MRTIGQCFAVVLFIFSRCKFYNINRHVLFPDFFLTFISIVQVKLTIRWFKSNEALLTFTVHVDTRDGASFGSPYVLKVISQEILWCVSRQTCDLDCALLCRKRFTLSLRPRSVMWLRWRRIWSFSALFYVVVTGPVTFKRLEEKERNSFCKVLHFASSNFK